MPPRGFSIDVPQWWLDDLDAEVRGRKLTHTDLAKFLIPTKPPLHGDHLKRAIAAARVKVTRFFDEDADKRVRTVEIVRAWSAALGLLMFEVRAESRDEARAMALAKNDPALFLRLAAASQVAAMVESGEARLEDLLAGRQGGALASADGEVAKRRGSRAARDRSSYTPRQRG